MSLIASKGEYAAIAGAGTTQATATEMPAYMVRVTSSSGNGSGVILPPMNRGEVAIVCNAITGASAIDLKVYPRSGGSINGATADSHLLLPATMAASFRAVDGAGNVIATF